jgi:RND family efflux transporter MFP subunit
MRRADTTVPDRGHPPPSNERSVLEEAFMSAPIAMRPPPTLAKRLALFAALLTLAVIAVGLGFRIVEAMGAQAALDAQRTESAAEANRAARAEFVHPAAAESAPLVVLTGTLEPIQSANLAFGLPGRVQTVDVALGQAVRAGDVLVTLDRSTIGAQSAQSSAAIGVADAQVAMLRDQVTTLETLVRSGGAPERQLTQARQQLAIAEAQLGQARAGRRQVAASASDHILRAPFDGIVTLVPSGVGVVANPGVPLVRVEDLSSLRLRTTVNQGELDVLRVGMTAVLEGSGASGQLHAVVRSLDAQTRRAPVEVHVPNPEGVLVANAFVRARVTAGEARAVLRIPASSRRPNGTVFVVGEGSRVEARDIVAEADADGSWLVTEGLAATDRVLLRPATARDGGVVTPVLRGADDAPAEASTERAER